MCAAVQLFRARRAAVHQKHKVQATPADLTHTKSQDVKTSASPLNWHSTNQSCETQGGCSLCILGELVERVLLRLHSVFQG